MSTLVQTVITEKMPAARLPDRATAPTRLLGKTARHGTLALLDQATVSGTRFLTMIVVGSDRFGSPEELGVYSLAFSFVLIVGCVLESLIAMPYTIYGNRVQGRERAEYAGSSLVYALVLALTVMLGLGGGVAVSATGIAVPHLTPILSILAIAVPSIILWEFARFVSFSHLQMVKAFALDLAMAAIQLSGLACLVLSGQVTAVAAYAVVTLACGLSSVVWLYASRRSFVIRRDQLLVVLRRNWSFSRWLFAAQAVSALNNQVLLWLLVALCGTEATGVFAACMFVLLLCNPFLLGINNMLIPKVARAFVHGGKAEVRQVVGKSTLFLGTTMGLVCIAVMACGDPAMQFLYGSRYSGQWLTLALLGIAAVTTGCSLSFNNGLWALERPDLTFRASVASLIATVATGAIMIPLWGVAGAACALLSASATSAVARYAGFLAAVQGTPRQGAPLQGETT